MKEPIILDSGKPGPVVLITAGVHGDEYEPMIAAQRLGEMLDSRILKGRVVIFSQVNSTAVQTDARCGVDGLDLARVCPGDSAGSPTMQDAAKVSAYIQSSQYLIDLHTGGKIFDIYPMAGYMLHPDQAVLEKQRQMALSFGLPVIWGTDYRPDGRTLSVARDANIPAIYVEYGGGLAARKKIIEAYQRGCINVLYSLEMIAAGELTSQALEYWTEDHTPLMGHLQSKMPAPADGLFISFVQLGTFIQKGTAWGEVVDLETRASSEVNADETGMVLFLRTQSVVKKGDSLGGVLAVNQQTDKLGR